ncbi:Scr1 family TA system antitoxin-like transcriptional regulator [Halostreptopolyspora alba]|uniref:XRE family transcriptional regulator n=1 Tax=Halostreptopolyspora alba TaxID=2487137 RepID=A0A3N0EDB1_9ACTN|nr:XRE family transcriptional regulator [Nocardiopsaceae bacterium YIM 96095]
MSDYQKARQALGVRLRELRTEAGLSGRELAHRIGWPPSKISKLEHGNQTASSDDLTAWAKGCGAPEVAGELAAHRRAMETHYTSWRRQLATGTRARQQSFGDVEQQSSLIQAFESACVPGLLQTPDYARHMLTRTIELHGAPDDVEEGVRARVQRQQVLYDPRRHFEVLLWEPALRMLICPPISSARARGESSTASRTDSMRSTMVAMHHPPHATTRPRSAAAVASLALGILGVLATPAFGLFTLLPALAALTGAYGLRTTHTHQLRGRGMALWGFWLGVAFFLLNVGLLMLAAVASRMGY